MTTRLCLSRKRNYRSYKMFEQTKYTANVNAFTKNTVGDTVLNKFYYSCFIKKAASNICVDFYSVVAVM